MSLYVHKRPSRNSAMVRSKGTGSLFEMNRLSHALLAISTGMQAGQSAGENEPAKKRQRTEAAIETLRQLDFFSESAKNATRELTRELEQPDRDAAANDGSAFLKRVAEIREADMNALDVEKQALTDANDAVLLKYKEPRVTIDLTGSDDEPNFAPPADTPASPGASSSSSAAATPKPAPQAPSLPPTPSVLPATLLAAVAPVAPPMPQILLPPDLTRIHGLYLAASTVTIEKGAQKGAAIGEYGLFTSRDVEPGEFLLFYTGAFFQAKTFNNLEKTDHATWAELANYCIESSYGTKRYDTTHAYIAAPVKTDADLLQFPAAAINEPNSKKGGRSNVYCMTVNDLDFGDDDDEEYQGIQLQGLALAIFSCQKITAGEELLWNYGPGYAHIRRAKAYAAGMPCKAGDPGFDHAPGEVDVHTRAREIWDNEHNKPLTSSRYSVVYRYENEAINVRNSEKESQEALGLAHFAPR